jgi:hypothetical protein
VLGLLVASAKSSFDSKLEEVEQSAAKIILLDQNLRQYGDDAKPVRELLRDVLVAKLNITWVESAMRVANQPKAVAVPPRIGIQEIRARILALTPGNNEQRSLQSRALAIVDDLTQTRWLLIEQSTASVSKPMLAIMVLWLATIAGCLGICAPRNATVLGVTLLCALSVSCAIFLILEMYDPFAGLLQISDAPMRTAIDYLNQ